MARESRFTFICNREERRLLENLSERLARTQSDVVRLLIREAARELAEPLRNPASDRQAAVSV